MNAIKRFTAVFMAVLMLVTTSVVANAAINEEDKKYLADELFEHLWFSLDWYNDYYKATKSVVLIEHNPLAAMYYFTVEAEVYTSDESLLEEFSNDKISAEEFLSEIEFDYKKAKNKNDKYKNSLIYGYGCEFSLSGGWHNCYDYGTWKFEDSDYNIFYGYFKEDDENFTLYENETKEVLGVYPKLIGYQYLDDSDEDVSNDDNGRNVGGGNGGTGGSGSSDDKRTSGNTDTPSSTNSSERDVKVTVSNANTESTKTDKVSGKEGNIEKCDPDGNNPAVTPEIASAIDEMKSAAQTQPTDEKISAEDKPAQVNKPNHTIRNVILITAVAAVIAAAAVLVLNKKKGENNGK